MNENNENQNNNPEKLKKSKSLIIKILVPLLIVVIIGGIYIFKNFKKEPEAEPISAEYALDATENFNLNDILSQGLPVMIDFGADSCQPCKEMAPVLKELNEELQGKAIIKFVDVWKNPNVAKEIPLRVIPTQFFFNSDGTPYVPEDAEISNFMMYEHKDTGQHFFTVHEGGLDKASILKILKNMGME